LTKKEDRLPGRFFKEVLGESEKTIRPEDLRLMLKEYYRLRDGIRISLGNLMIYGQVK